jgi:hypothetical protein
MGYRYMAADVAMLNSDLDKLRAEIVRLSAETIAQEKVVTLMSENARLRAALRTIAKHCDSHSDFPHDLDNIQLYAKQVLAGSI